ncbi:hypothetical protein DL769_004602 [Monosporascus sp. CRB-8-3]|nr:hypothetical protein DL769_004602 [Monosporascus sp. CRB-8-3]
MAPNTPNTPTKRFIKQIPGQRKITAFLGRTGNPTPTPAPPGPATARAVAKPSEDVTNEASLGYRESAIRAAPANPPSTPASGPPPEPAPPGPATARAVAKPSEDVTDKTSLGRPAPTFRAPFLMRHGIKGEFDEEEQTIIEYLLKRRVIPRCSRTWQATQATLYNFGLGSDHELRPWVFDWIQCDLDALKAEIQKRNIPIPTPLPDLPRYGHVYGAERALLTVLIKDGIRRLEEQVSQGH